MNKFEILSECLEFIEENLDSEISPENLAKACGYSLSNLQKMFRCTFRIGVSDYISRRKLTRAARDLINTDDNVLDIAMKYGYNSHEVFSRAFSRLWGVNPSVFRKSSTFSDIFPKFDNRTTMTQYTDERGNTYMIQKRFDVSHLYDFIKERRGCFVICFDMVGLMRINDTYGSAAGDLAIAKCLLNIDREAGENMLPIRIGGDEFILITDSKDRQTAEKTAEKILSHNGETIKSADTDVDVSLRAGYAVIPESGNIRYNDLFDRFVAAGHENM